MVTDDNNRLDKKPLNIKTEGIRQERCYLVAKKEAIEIAMLAVRLLNNQELSI